jgi:glucokinase
MRKADPVEHVLAGDIGGTNARLRLYDRTGAKVRHEAVLPSAGAPSLAAIVGRYLVERRATVRSAVLGVAGPVVNGISHVTNLPWRSIDEKKLARELKIPRVSLMNDLAAVAIGCTRLGPSARTVLAKGRSLKGVNLAVIAAGTGLGEALLVWDRDHFVPCQTEGGHADFAPTTELEVDLYHFLKRRLSITRVSYERVLSGPGLGNVYDFFVERDGEATANAKELQNGDRNAKIASLGLSGKSRAASQAIDLFARVYGSESGNLILKGLALGGVYLSGRIANDIIPHRREIFLAGMRDKGRLTSFVQRVPVTVVKDSLVGLAGAGYLAARLASR